MKFYAAAFYLMSCFFLKVFGSFFYIERNVEKITADIADKMSMELKLGIKSVFASRGFDSFNFALIDEDI